MADIKISALTGASTLDGTEEVAIVQTGATVKATTQAIADLGGSNFLEAIYTFTDPTLDGTQVIAIPSAVGKTILISEMAWTFDFTGTITGVATLSTNFEFDGVSQTSASIAQVATTKGRGRARAGDRVLYGTAGQNTNLMIKVSGAGDVMTGDLVVKLWYTLVDETTAFN